MTTHALLQVYPLEALDLPSKESGCDVLATGTQEELTTFLEDYRQRHQAAVQERVAWDDGREWDSDFDAKCDELCRRHAVNTVIPDVEFEIVPIGVQVCDIPQPS